MRENSVLMLGPNADGWEFWMGNISTFYQLCWEGNVFDIGTIDEIDAKMSAHIEDFEEQSTGQGSTGSTLLYDKFSRAIAPAGIRTEHKLMCQ